MISSFAMLVSTGAAQADRFHGGAVVHGGGGWHGGGVSVRGGGEWHGGGGWHGPVRVYHNGGYYGRREPIYMGRPYIRERYYDVRYRPELIVENYGPRDGYVWVRGSWQWNGAEWIWYPGHYQPVY